uniref:Ig-like domain-containing protein n=1 Tax=Periophthalmus magnuspinnatus TaxID=409849 RepID=A0A3B3ZP43_9GOBI
MLQIMFCSTICTKVLKCTSSKDPLTIYCDIESFYPEDMFVSWLQNGTALPEYPTLDQNPDGTYTTRRFYTLTPKQRQQGGEVGCACQVSYVGKDKIVEEKVSEKFTILCKKLIFE